VSRFDESRSFNPGLARHRLMIMRPVKTKDAFNADVVTPVLHATVGAQVTALQGRELEAVQQHWADARYRIRMQYTPGIEREFTIEWPLASGTLTLDILDVQDPSGVANYTQIYAKDTHAR
jgi:head-tail adaptor